jgi:tetratricopeptide (TPR) repeat protein
MTTNPILVQPRTIVTFWDNIMLQLAPSLIEMAIDASLQGNVMEAIRVYETAYQCLHIPVADDFVNSFPNSLPTTSFLSRRHKTKITEEYESSDLYQEDEYDVGPRILKTHTCIKTTWALGMDLSFIEAVIALNKGILHHIQGDHDTARFLYQRVITIMQHLLQQRNDETIHLSNTILEMGMRAHNNMGHICYIDADEDSSLEHFDASLTFAKQLSTTSHWHRIEYACVLSNRCRASWRNGDMSDSFYQGLHSVLLIRSESLPWNHPDVAASHFNLGVAEYARQNISQSTMHFTQYLQIASFHAKDYNSDLELVPALVYILLMRHEDKEDNLSLELVRGLRALLDKRQDQGPYSPEVASILNFIGTNLFHQRDFESALTFFKEELRLEEILDEYTDDVRVSVTCNNIGRIFQELGNLHEAMNYYQRALEKDYGNINNVYKGKGSTMMPASAESLDYKDMSTVDPLTINLYSTAWYNLGLIHDKLRAYSNAICAFQMALKLRVMMLGDDHPDIACLHYNIGVLQMENYILNDASNSFKEALHIRRASACGQLADCHLVKTLEKLASLQKANGDVAGALEVCYEVLRIKETSAEYDAISRLTEMGMTHRAIAELYHANGDLNAALHSAVESANLLLLQLDNDSKNQSQIENTEQLVLSWLLVGSLFHELNEPTKAHRMFEQALERIECTVSNAHNEKTTNSALDSLREVTLLLTTTRCAPLA